MRGNIGGGLALVIASGLAQAVNGQIPTVHMTSTTVAKVSAPARRPYTAEYEEILIETKDRPIPYVQEWTEVDARDSLGRQIIARTQIAINKHETRHTRFQFLDRTANISAQWTPEDISALESETSCSASAPAAPPAAVPVKPISPPVDDPVAKAHEMIEAAREKIRADLEDRPEFSKTVVTGVNKDLGTSIIQGYEVRGNRATRRFPARSMLRNSIEQVETDERWIATDPGILGLEVIRIQDGPSMGKRTRQLMKLTEGEPDASLYQPYSVYKMAAQIRKMHEAQCPQPFLPVPVPAPTR